MARVSVEESWWTDPRRRKLARLVGSEALADGVMIAAWRLAQQYRGKGDGLIPHDVWETLDHGADILAAKLGAAHETGVYVRGARDFLDWVVGQREKASQAGKISAQRLRDERGRLLPRDKSNAGPTPVQRRSNASPTLTNEVQLSVSVSDSVSKSRSSSNDDNARRRVSFTHPAFAMESRFHPDAEKYLDALKQLGPGVAGSLRNNLAELIAHFETVQAFVDYANGLFESADRKTAGDALARDRYIAASIKRDLGVA